MAAVIQAREAAAAEKKAVVLAMMKAVAEEKDRAVAEKSAAEAVEDHEGEEGPAVLEHSGVHMQEPSPKRVLGSIADCLEKGARNLAVAMPSDAEADWENVKEMKE